MCCADAILRIGAGLVPGYRLLLHKLVVGYRQSQYCTNAQKPFENATKCAFAVEAAIQLEKRMPNPFIYSIYYSSIFLSHHCPAVYLKHREIELKNVENNEIPHVFSS